MTKPVDETVDELTNKPPGDELRGQYGGIMPEYIRGLEKGLSFLIEAKDYEIDLDIDSEQPDIETILRGFLDLVVNGYIEMLQGEKVRLLEGMNEAESV